MLNLRWGDLDRQSQVEEVDLTPRNYNDLQTQIACLHDGDLRLGLPL